MSEIASNRIYDFYARFYNRFELLFSRRLERALNGLEFHYHDRVLDIGVGTGFSLALYPSQVSVTGIDSSEAMLQRARQRIPDEADSQRTGKPSRIELMHADAHELPFPDGTFDHVILSHVVSTLADPAQCLAQAIRVTRERGHIMIISHLRSGHRFINWMENLLNPICRRLGWRTNLSQQELFSKVTLHAAPAQTQRGLFQIIYLQKFQNGVRIVPPPTTAAPTGRYHSIHRALRSSARIMQQGA